MRVFHSLPACACISSEHHLDFPVRTFPCHPLQPDFAEIDQGRLGQNAWDGLVCLDMKKRVGSIEDGLPVSFSSHFRPRFNRALSPDISCTILLFRLFVSAPFFVIQRRRSLRTLSRWKLTSLQHYLDVRFLVCRPPRLRCLTQIVNMAAAHSKSHVPGGNSYGWPPHCGRGTRSLLRSGCAARC